MNVGIFYSGPVPDAGGAYTFESDILEGFLRIRRESPNQFMLLCFPEVAAGLRNTVRGAIAVHAIRAGWARRRIVSLLHTSDSLRARLPLRSWLDSAADEANVDLLWILGKGPCLTMRPYIAVVWDVQHLVTPWFPELSSRTWDWREQTHGWYLRRATALITGTERGREELQRFYQLPSERIFILPHPTPWFALEAAPETESDIFQRFGVKIPYLLYPAQFWPHKNHINLILALSHLRSSYGIPLDLVLVGSDKGNQKYVEQYAFERKVSDAVHFVGFVSRSDLIALYQRAFALVYASWCGPENLPPLEAFALRCPVVATRIPGADEQLGDAALLAEPGDPRDIAAKVALLHSDENFRNKLISKGLKRASTWTSTNYVRGVFRILDSLEPIRRTWATTLS